MKRLDNKISLVTSSTRGIGLEIAKKLGDNGSKVYLAVRRLDAGKKIADEIIENGGKADVVYFDASKPETYKTMIEEVINKEKKLDVLVNNYGGTDVKADFDVVTGNTEDFFRIVQDNLQSVYLPCKEVIPHMIKNGGGSIINISTIGSVTPDLSRVAYVVSKAAINSLTQNIAVQYARQGIRCNAILPGLIATDAAMDNMSDEFIKGFLRHVPLNRIGKPEDIASAALFYASDESSFITGDLIEVAGGFGLPTPLYGDSITK
ncbi:SDR family NAD(P)-dependent oxidoreductase [Clostridium tertium]|uniref:7alpha-hydroxysteroid dehydrogenase n=1 Tax=Clostridium TaxID=1485 RepID=UPI000DCF987B|nr:MULTISPECIES: SDR family NAD(P)-dependent oxidoreductase [Clostridium]MBS5307607.1 SDR family oxidoreductase [Clostridium sp.]MDB1924344.1 SDR family NAD(P)-dependent oxidoreductase [Clostridium tertium]MDB1927933.1 SDR family NAD(P)-dependent oxidoreductase [Clostridium tertium]MDB1931421.1 SDR family NAD(P)-dependent oxidoreductase [Clostridium tertium]MDB1931820.1 SDR family NAD(P)-dependent oxidoreductase [Clostridium tertium]